jgi:hypothetical protein
MQTPIWGRTDSWNAWSPKGKEGRREQRQATCGRTGRRCQGGAPGAVVGQKTRQLRVAGCGEGTMGEYGQLCEPFGNHNREALCTSA